MVQALEQQYDSFERAENRARACSPRDQPLPSGEEIGRQFEQFLAGLDGPTDGPTPTPAERTVRDRIRRASWSSCSTSRSSTTNLFRGLQPDTDRQRVFGGQVAAQALVAAVRTVDPAYVVHSLHSYFLRPGDTSIPIIYDVEALRDGRSFATRRVVARQHGRPIYYQTANFQMPEDGIEHQDAMPEVIPPEEGLDLVALMRGNDDADADALAKEWASLDARYVGNSAARAARGPGAPGRWPGCGSGCRRASATTRGCTWPRSPMPAT